MLALHREINIVFVEQSFPAETFAPKLQIEQQVESKRLPRGVEMERRRRIYKYLKIEDALETEGVILKDILPPSAILSILTGEEMYDLFSPAHLLPLEIFDDEDYDCRCACDKINQFCRTAIFYSYNSFLFAQEMN